MLRLETFWPLLLREVMAYLSPAIKCILMVQEKVSDSEGWPTRKQGTQWMWNRDCRHQAEGAGPDGRVDFQRQELQLDWLPSRRDFKVGTRMWGC